jgi:hypothetical protein
MALSKPEGFGRLWWGMIHSAAAGAKTPEKRKEFRRFMLVTVPTLLPCDACSAHITETMRKYDIDKYMGSEEQLLLWTYLIHAAVSEMLQKKDKPSYNEIKRLYLPEPGVVCTTVCSVDDEGNPPPHSPGQRQSGGSSRRSQNFRYKV